MDAGNPSREGDRRKKSRKKSEQRCLSRRAAASAENPARAYVAAFLPSRPSRLVGARAGLLAPPSDVAFGGRLNALYKIHRIVETGFKKSDYRRPHAGPLQKFQPLNRRRA
jgi:hypothetical protein